MCLCGSLMGPAKCVFLPPPLGVHVYVPSHSIIMALSAWSRSFDSLVFISFSESDRLGSWIKAFVRQPLTALLEMKSTFPRERQGLHSFGHLGRLVAIQAGGGGFIWMQWRTCPSVTQPDSRACFPPNRSRLSPRLFSPWLSLTLPMSSQHSSHPLLRKLLRAEDCLHSECIVVTRHCDRFAKEAIQMDGEIKLALWAFHFNGDD